MIICGFFLIFDNLNKSVQSVQLFSLSPLVQLSVYHQHAQPLGNLVVLVPGLYLGQVGHLPPQWLA